MLWGTHLDKGILHVRGPNEIQVLLQIRIKILKDELERVDVKDNLE